jgi:tRNA(Ile2) C34 agmatinyltransferase TiaS
MGYTKEELFKMTRKEQEKIAKAKKVEIKSTDKEFEVVEKIIQVPQPKPLTLNIVKVTCRHCGATMRHVGQTDYVCDKCLSKLSIMG